MPLPPRRAPDWVARINQMATELPAQTIYHILRLAYENTLTDDQVAALVLHEWKHLQYGRAYDTLH